MATTVFTNGTVFDGHRYLGRGTVVVEDGRVQAVEAGGGGKSGLDRGKSGLDRGNSRLDRVVDLGGGVVAPGFVDAHVHAVQGGLERVRGDLTEDGTRDACLARIAGYADAHPGLPWILGGGWAMSAFPGGAPS